MAPATGPADGENHDPMTDPSSRYVTARRNPLARHVVLIDGLARVGKYALGSVLSSFDRVEHMFVQVTMIEQLAWLHSFGLMSRETAISVLQLQVDQWGYYSILGRQMNFRPGDKSSIWKSRDPSMYFERLSLPDGDEAVDRLDQLDPIFVFVTHDGLSYSDVYFEPFEDFRAVNIVRHPVDLAYSWYKFGWGRRWDDRKAFTLLLQGRKGRVPYFAHGWIEEYESLGEMDRVIRGIHACTERYARLFASLSAERRARIFRLAFEELVAEPGPLLERLCRFLGTRPSLATPAILARERIPRPHPAHDREARWAAIAREASPECLALLEKLARDHERDTLD